MAVIDGIRRVGWAAAALLLGAAACGAQDEATNGGSSGGSSSGGSSGASSSADGGTSGSYAGVDSGKSSSDRSLDGASASDGFAGGSPPAPCSSVTYAARSGTAFDITFTFDRTYACGQFASGDWFVVPDTEGGAVTITSVSPAVTTGRNGVAVNPLPIRGGKDPEVWDDRFSTKYTPPTLTFPYAAHGGESIVKVASAGATVQNKTPIQFAAVLTVLPSVPADPTRTFRPPYYGTYKPLHTTNELQTQLLSRLPKTPSTPSAADLVTHNLPGGIRMEGDNQSVDGFEVCDAMPPGYGGCRAWGGDVWKSDTEVVSWLNLADVCGTTPCTASQDLAVKLPILVRYVQYGIDFQGARRASTWSGVFRGGGGNGAGKLFLFAFAAAMLDSGEMRSDLSPDGRAWFTESASYHRGYGNVVLWGQDTPWDSEKGYWDDFKVIANGTQSDPYKYIDGGGNSPEAGTSYQNTLAQQTKYSAFLMRLMPAFQTAWTYTPDQILEYGDRWTNVGAWTLPDPCAPKSGTYGVDYGPDGKGGCIKGSGRDPSGHGANKNGGNRGSDLEEEIWNAYRSCVDAKTCQGQAP